MPATLPDYEGYTGVEGPHVTVEDVERELGKLIQSTTTVTGPYFSETYKDTLIGKWIMVEQALALHFVDWDSASTDNLPAEVIMLEEAILYRVCARALRHVQANKRENITGETPSYHALVVDYERMASDLLHVVAGPRSSYCIDYDTIEELYPGTTSDDFQVIQGDKTSCGTCGSPNCECDCDE